MGTGNEGRILMDLSIQTMSNYVEDGLLIDPNLPLC